MLFKSISSLFSFLWVKSEYVNLKETLGAVTQERDLALLERNQLQGKLENLEQVLKVRNTVLIVYGWAIFLSSVLCGGLMKSCEGVDARSSLHPPHLSLSFSSSFTVQGIWAFLLSFPTLNAFRPPSPAQQHCRMWLLCLAKDPDFDFMRMGQ